MKTTAWEGSNGSTYDVTAYWPNKSTSEIVVHFDPPIRAGSSLSCSARWDWPGYSRALANGGQEDFWVNFSQPVSHAEHVVTLARAPKQSRPRFSAIGDVEPTEEVGSPWRIRFVADACTPGEKFGVRIDTQ